MRRARAALVGLATAYGVSESVCAAVVRPPGDEVRRNERVENWYRIPDSNR